MVRINKTRFYAAVGITTLGSFILAGCAPPTSATTGTGASSTASAKPFDDAANTMGRVEEARTEMDTAIDAKSSDQVHAADTKIRDTVGMLPDKSAALPDDKRKTLDAHVKNVGELADMTDKAGDSGDWKSAHEHQTAMHNALDMIKGVYPADMMQSHMHMPGMNKSGTGIPGGPGGKMGGPPMGGMGGKMGGRMGGPPMGGMGGKMPNDAPAPASPPAADKPMPGGGMKGDM